MQRRRKPGGDLPVGLVVVIVAAAALAALAGLFKLALAIVLAAFAAGMVLRLVRGTR